MKTRKLLTIGIILVLMLSLLGVQALAAGESAQVYVTISDGSLVMAQEAINVTDIDGDGALTINDALILAHDAKFEGGSAAGYAAVDGDWGLSISKLWGIENGGSYGYYVNNASAMGLTDPVKAGDYLNAFVYTDTAAYSDAYCFFDVNTASAENGGELTLTLSMAGYDENWTPVVLPAEGAVILVNGEATSVKTDAEGKATIKFDKAGDFIISAKSDSAILVPPVCAVAVSGPSVSTGAIAGIAAAAVVVIAAVIFFVARKKKK